MQITSAKMVSAAKLKKAQDAITACVYAEKLTELYKIFLLHLEGDAGGSLLQREVKKY
jgi:F-type H+-transporting ATPase subunit gamma